MKILSVTPSSGGSELARISVEVADGVRLHEVKVMRSGNVFARNATLGRNAINQIFDLARGACHNDRNPS
jgi:hypothetical protein